MAFSTVAFLSGPFSNSYRELQYATGVINYSYKLPLLGGSGTGKSPQGTSINSSGFLDSPLTGFIYGSGKFLEEKSANLTGFYFDSINIKTD